MPTPIRNRTAVWFAGLCCCAQFGFAQGETAAGGLRPAEAEQIAFFEAQIRPLLIEHCLECHASDTEPNGGLLLDSRPNWERGGDSGAAIVPLDPAASSLMRAVLYEDPDLQMPPDGKLPEGKINALRAWIESGAADPRSEVSVKPSSTKALSVADAQQHSEAGKLTQMIECKLGDNKPHRGLLRFAEQFPDAQAVQIVYGLRQEEFRSGIRIADAAHWLMGLSA